MKRDNFGSKFGVLAAAAGSAVGLGNIWKFPYVTGKNGGGAFLLLYIACVALMGVPVMIAEFSLGRKTQANAVDAYKKLQGKGPWYLAGILAVITPFIILSFYSIIAGWVLSYVVGSATGKVVNISTGELGNYFTQVTSGVYTPMFWTFLVIVITAAIVIAGVQSGLEKYSKILMPALFVILVVLMIRSVTLKGSSQGLEFLFKPDFSKLTGTSVLEALGQAFYSLSLGMGIIITYGSYIKKDENLISLSAQVAITDTLVAILSGIVIFPAVFAYGLEPNSGPALIFITLPTVFHSMPFGSFFATLFFTLVAIAAITSTISLLEVSVAFITEKFKINRKVATIIIALGTFLLSIPSSLSFGPWAEVTIFGKNIFDALDFLASNIFLPLGGIFVTLFVGYVWGINNAMVEITNEGAIKFNLKKLFTFVIKILAPIAIFLILLFSTGIIK